MQKAEMHLKTAPCFYHINSSSSQGLQASVSGAASGSRIVDLKSVVRGLPPKANKSRCVVCMM